MHILIENEATWPRDIVELLDRVRATLQDHLAFEKTRCVGAVTSYEKHQRRAIVNPLQRQRDLAVSELARMLEKHQVIVCHCTRLTMDEIADIEENGLQLLSPELCQGRIRRRADAGDLNSEEARVLLERCAKRFQRDDGSLGANRIWGTLGRTALNDEEELGSAFAFWGGEALLELPATAPYYRMGQGCIVEFHMPALGTTLGSIPEVFVDWYLLARGGTTEGAIPDICWDSPVPASDITRLITSGDPEFERLTGASMWRSYDPFCGSRRTA